MDLTPLRIAAAGGSIDGIEATRLVAAGFTLLQRCAPLVRALAGRRSAIVLPDCAQFLVALAASDGRGAVLCDPGAEPSELAAQLVEGNAGAVFTTRALADRVIRMTPGPDALPVVLLDDAPTSATLVTPDGASTRIDLGSHFGLELEGDVDAPGRAEECVVCWEPTGRGPVQPVILTHRQILAARRPGEAPRESYFTRAGFLGAFAAPLLAGAALATSDQR